MRSEIFGMLIILTFSGCKSSSYLPAVSENLDAAVSNAIAAVKPPDHAASAPAGIQEDLAVSEIAKVLQGSADWTPTDRICGGHYQRTHEQVNERASNDI